MTVQRKKLHQLFFPLFFETLFMMLAGMVDTLMLSSEGDYAVGAVGTANTYIGLFIIMFSIISSGMVAVMTQYIGANRPGVAHQALKLGLMFNLSVGVVITGVLIFGTDAILKAVGIARDLEEPARIYLRTIGAFCICNALIPIFSSYLRSFGHTTPTMVATVVANIINVVLNGLFLFVMHWGVFGVALATGISRLVNLLWLCIAARYHIKPEKDASVGLKVSIDSITPSLLIFAVLLCLVAMLTKVVGCGLGAKVCSCNWKESLQIGVGMISRGEVALIVAQKGYAAGMLDDTLFAPIVIMVIVTTLITPILLKLVMSDKA